jgi:hypothetical protein
MFLCNLRLFVGALLSAVLFIPALAQTVPTTVTFASQTYNTGPKPADVVSGDFNQDGRPDLAVIDGQASSVQVLLGVGGGRFSLGSNTNTGTSPVHIVTGTFTLSGHQDLAVANAGDSTVTILLGKGDGTFMPRSFQLIGVPRALAGVNLLNNGLTQLAVVECTRAEVPCSLNIYQGDTHAVFSLSQMIPLPGAPVADGLIASEDFNHDRKPDIAVGTDKQALIFVNTSRFNGTGAATVALRTIITPPKTGFINALVAGHFVKNKPTPDLAIEVFDNVIASNLPNSDYIFLNNGSASFSLKGKVPGSRGFGHVLAVADINGDGIQDLFLLGNSVQHNGDLTYALGHGDGTFSTPQPVSAFSGGINSSLIARDLNLDSRHDVIVASNGPMGGPAFVDVLLNQNAATNCPPPGSATRSVKICSARASLDLISIKASGNSPNGVKRVELWVDGVKRTQSFGDQLRATVSASPGIHHVTVVGVDLYDGLVKQAIAVSVP